MRLVSFLTFMLLAACAPPAGQAQVQRLDVRITGSFSKLFSLRDDGNGYIEKYDELPIKRQSFRLPPSHVKAIFKKFEPFLAKSEPATDENMAKVLEGRCPDGKWGSSDAGGVYILWVQKPINRQYRADFNCDYAQDAARNQALLDKAESVFSEFK